MFYTVEIFTSYAVSLIPQIVVTLNEKYALEKFLKG